MKIGYVRVSTDTQNIDSQVSMLQKYGCDRIYSDVVCGIKKRIELDNLINHVLRPYDTLVVYKLDRVGRSLIDLLSIIQLLNDRKINFISLSEKIDTSTASGRLFFSISAAFAEYERSVIQERTIVGLSNARDKGKKLGRPVGIKNCDKAFVAYDLFHFGNKSANDIAKILGIGIATVYRYIKLAEKLKEK